ncbi:enoyl-CoA hydratase-related protein [Amorphus sp. 3PC139-8]|uniref:enoyl-CoA hydratase-related protein n=1 Tax=Amorphus sp. 3PC139-8 TaxID=2735676 RepID=UPI00345DDC7F
MSNTEAPVLTERPESGIAVVRINRPKARNALNMATRRALADAFTALAEDGEIRAIVLTGDDQAFAAGADLKEFVDADPIEVAKRRVERLWGAISGTPQPIVAAVSGYALGGGLELAMMADIIVAGETAQLGQPEVRVGIMPGAGGTQRLTRAVGKFHAMRLCLLGKPISATEAFQIGLVSQVVPDEEVFETAMKMAKTIAGLPPLATQAVKESVLQAENGSLESGLALERKAFQLLFASKDKSEGMTAFLEKRKPSFTGE